MFTFLVGTLSVCYPMHMNTATSILTELQATIDLYYISMHVARKRVNVKNDDLSDYSDEVLEIRERYERSMLEIIYKYGNDELTRVFTSSMLWDFVGVTLDGVVKFSFDSFTAVWFAHRMVEGEEITL